LPVLVVNAQHLKRLCRLEASFETVSPGRGGGGLGLLSSRLSYWYLGQYTLDMETLKLSPFSDLKTSGRVTEESFDSSREQEVSHFSKIRDQVWSPPNLPFMGWCVRS
jgi:hypothetical protein